MPVRQENKIGTGEMEVFRHGSEEGGRWRWRVCHGSEEGGRWTLEGVVARASDFGRS